jgi:hypothetical protein
MIMLSSFLYDMYFISNFKTKEMVGWIRF